MKNPLISVVIPAFNAEPDIAACIDSLITQSYQPLEIIVVDDGSSDETAKILKKIKGIRYLKQEHLGPGAARNKGALKAKGEILVFVDSDMTFDKSFIDKLTLPIREGETIGTFSKEEFAANSQNPWARNWSLNRGWQKGRMHPANYPDTQKVFRAIIKEKFDSVGGFDPQVGYTDDWTLSTKLGKEAVAAEGAVFYHRNPETLKEAFIQSKWMAMRPYKLGLLGRIAALIRVSLPFSLIIGFGKSIRNKKASFLAFKLIVDLASFIGILGMFFGQKRVK